jgi:sugar phosphate isomerase/epimerase
VAEERSPEPLPWASWQSHTSTPVTAPGIPNELVLSTACFGSRLDSIEDQAFAAVAMGFRQIELGLSDAPPRLNGYEDTRRETGVQVSSIVAGCLKPRGERMASFLLGSTKDDEREQALLSVRRHIQLAQRMGAPVVIVRCAPVSDPKLAQEADDLRRKIAREGQTEELTESARALMRKVTKKGQRQVEHLCRSLHALLGEFPQTRIAVEPARRIEDLLGFEAMGWVLDDLKGKGLGYWHDTGFVHAQGELGLPGQGDWLDAFAPRMLGVHLQDVAESECELPPGRGEVDFRLLGEYVPRTACRVVQVNPRHGRSEILDCVQFLAALGL